MVRNCAMFRGMKIVREKPDEGELEVRFSQRSPKRIVDKLDEVAESIKDAKGKPMSRNDLINAILDQSLTDKSFVLRIKG